MAPLQTSATPDLVAAELERAARRFHEYRVLDKSSEHRHWKFERCPADACKSARQCLGMDPMPEGKPRAQREPGQE